MILGKLAVLPSLASIDRSFGYRRLAMLRTVLSTQCHNLSDSKKLVLMGSNLTSQTHM